MDKDLFNNTMRAIAKNKFLLTGAVFFVWIALFDPSSCFDRNRLKKERDNLVNEKEFYINKIKNDSTSLYELKTNDENLEKFARENYLMKEEKEEVFVIVEDENKSAN